MDLKSLARLAVALDRRIQERASWPDSPEEALFSRWPIRPPFPSADVLQTPLCDFVKPHQISRRLKNVMRSGAPETKISVGALLVDPEEAVRMLLRVPRLGRALAAELLLHVTYRIVFRGEDKDPVDIIKPGSLLGVAIALDWRVSEAPDLASLCGPTPALSEDVLQTTVCDFVDPDQLSSLFLNALRRSEPSASLTVGALLEDPEEAARMLVGAPRIAQKRVAELLLHVARRIFNPVCEEDYESAEDAVLAAIDRLPDRHHEIIRRRYGFGESMRETLLDLSLRFGLSRERIRQIELDAFRRLRRSANSSFAQLLEERRRRIWNECSGGEAILRFSRRSDGRLCRFEERVDSLSLLAIDMEHGGFLGWLENCAVPFEGGWIAPGSDLSRLDVDRERIVRALTCVATPRPVSDLARRLETPPDRIAVTIHSTGDVSAHAGYVKQGLLGRKCRRTIGLRRTVADFGLDGAFDIQTLVAAYRERFPRDRVGSRSVLIQVTEAPHLFLRLFDSLWITLPGPVRPPPGGRLPFERRPLGGDDEGKVPGGLAAWLIDYFRREGPQRIVSLRTAALACRDVSPGAAGTVLHMQPCFRKIAPGVYDIYSGDPAAPTADRVPKVLLSGRQCSAYAWSRYAGVPIDYFPAWGPGFEHGLCEWAKTHAHSNVFRSLMAVADPACWPADEATRRDWREIQSKYADWRLAVGAGELVVKGLPNPREFLACLAHVVLFKGISWLGVNRASQRTFRDRKAIVMLALLVAMDLIVPPDDWLRHHQPTAAASEALERLLAEQFATGSLSWGDGALAELRREAARNFSTAERGWLNSDVLALVRKGLLHDA